MLSLQPEEEIQLKRINLILHEQDLESHLSREYQFVTLKQTPERGRWSELQELSQY